MTIAYSMNGGTEIHGITSTWRKVPKRLNSDATNDFSPSAINTWDIEIIDMTNYETLVAAQGTLLASLETNDFDAQNSGKTYSSNVFLEGVVGGLHQALNVLGLQVQFRVVI